MIALDTNVLVRYAIKDDRRQAALATELLATSQCYVLKTVLLELVWVLSSPAGYGLSREIVSSRLYHILGLPNVETEGAPRVAQALAWYAAGMDFADALHLSGSDELTALVTFDRKLAKAADQLGAVPPVRLLS
jgi:predicted nucleic-acid-binding protein